MMSASDDTNENTVVPISVYSEELLKSLKLGTEYLVPPDGLVDETGLILEKNQETSALQLRWGSSSTVKETPFCIDFTTPETQKRLKSWNRELLVKSMGRGVMDGDSAGKQMPIVFDFTAGLGRDSLLLAASGYRVILIERNPVMYHLLNDAVGRLTVFDPVLGKRMVVVNQDSADIGSFLDDKASILGKIYHQKISSEKEDATHLPSISISVYLDPMYPSNTIGKKAKVKKESQMMHRIIGRSVTGPGNNRNNLNLLRNAMRVANTKVVVKRPLGTDQLQKVGDINSDTYGNDHLHYGLTPPSSCVAGSTHRFDVYLPVSLSK